ncbi:MAG TPA: MerR family transcriptional regulator [Vicinamibacterales bacterium]|nr:MerR family transcriptional regulator [Vicinamibacterales bacterium]
MHYRVGDFAALTGVTVRALQHYDRVGLLKPSRTESGHRIYSEADRQRVRHILALRSVGMSLQRIGEVLAAAPARLPEIFSAQRASLEEARTGIDEAIRTLERLAIEEDDASNTPSLLDRLSATVEMHGVLESMRGYFSEDAWKKWGEGYFTDWPSPAWRAVFRDIEAALDIDPASDRAQELLKRATTLWDAAIGSDSVLRRAVREGYGNAWNARDRWPRELQRRYAEFRVEAIGKFLGNAAMASWRRNGLIHTYTTGQRTSA